MTPRRLWLQWADRAAAVSREGATRSQTTAKTPPAGVADNGARVDAEVVEPLLTLTMQTSGESGEGLRALDTSDRGERRHLGAAIRWAVRYALYASYVLLSRRSIEPISHAIRAWVPLGKAQRLDRVAYESPALPLSYSAAAIKLIERDPERQPPAQERITIEQHIPAGDKSRTLRGHEQSRRSRPGERLDTSAGGAG
jgi:hypothetical protein